MKKVWMMALPLMAAFTACSDDDGPKGPVVEYEVITFENCEFAEGAKNNVVKNAEFSYEDLGAKFVGQDYYSMYGGCVVSGAAKIQDSGTFTIGDKFVTYAVVVAHLLYIRAGCG